MYNVENFDVPQGYKMSEYCLVLARDIYEGVNVEDTKDKLFRMTYPLMMNEMQKYRNLRNMEDLVTDLSFAFMKTIKSFDPCKTGASFIGYYRKTLFSEVITNEYGKYKRTEKDRELKRKFEGTLSSLDDIVYNDKGSEVGYLQDIIEDDSVDILKEVLDDNCIDIAHQIIDEMFSGLRRGRRSDKPKEIFTKYIDGILTGDEINGNQLSREYGMGRSGVSNIILYYRPIFADRLRQYYGEGNNMLR